MADSNSAVQPWGESIDEALHRRLESIDSGRYRQSNERVLSDFAGWLATERGVTELGDISTTDCRRYAQHLRSRVQDADDSLDSGRSARRYFAYVRAWLAWCVDDERLPSNPARPNRASDPLPETTEAADQQFWSEREREAICATADARVEQALDGDVDTDRAYRDRALVYTLAWSGCRGAELVREPADDRRDGLRWRDVDLAAGLLDVLGKARDADEPPAPLLEPAHDPLRRWRDRQSPDPTDVVFPRMDRAAPADPPAISTQALRDLLETLCEWSDYEFAEALQPHGARRGLGHDLYEKSAELAQEVLRHKSIETTHESYREEQQASVREAAEDALLESED